MRALSTDFRNALEASANGDAPIQFITITHPSLSEPIRAVNDIVDYVFGGETFEAAPFQTELLSDGDRPPTATLRFNNVNRRVGQAVQSIDTSVRLLQQIVPSSEFGAVVDGVRTEIGSPTAEYTAPRLRLRNVRGDAMTVEGELWSYDLTREPYPAIRTTKDRLPALFA